jgi:hypothetical protein
MARAGSVDFEPGGLSRGATAGLIAAGAMSLLRMIAHRTGLIDRMVPQELHTDLLGVDPASNAPGHQLGAELLHHGVSAAAAALFAAVAPRRPSPIAGVGLGVALWAFDVFVLIPALRVERAGGYAVDLAAHALYGVAVAFTLEELAEQRPAWAARAGRLRRVG